MIRDKTKTEKTPGSVSSTISTGIDCEAISRIEGLIHKKKFITRVFTEGEYADCLRKKNPARHLAGRFAAKEACLKALGTGLTRGIRWRDIEVINDNNGAPALILTQRARALMEGDGGRDKKIFLSLSYGADLAVAFVVIG